MSEPTGEDSVLRFVEALERNDWESAQRLLEEARSHPDLLQDMRAAWLLHVSVGLLPAPDSEEALQRFWIRSQRPPEEHWWERWLGRQHRERGGGDEPPDRHSLR